MTSKIVPVEEVFTEIPDDPHNVLLTIPPEFVEQLQWKEGDPLTITVEDGRMTLRRTYDTETQEKT